MAINLERLAELRDDERLVGGDTYSVQGVEIEMPTSKSRPGERHRHWQRRVFSDILPDSPNADAPEKIPFRILNSLTTARNTKVSLEETMSGDFSCLRPLYEMSTRGSMRVPLGFHVLAVKGTEERPNTRAFTEQTFLMLARDREGTVEKSLVDNFLQRFRLPPGELDLAQEFLLESMEPKWDPATEFVTELDPDGPGYPPFARDAAELFQKDLATLAGVELPTSDFFRFSNSLLALHFGLYQPRLAWRLNPAVDAILDAVSEPESVTVAEVERLERGDHRESNFNGRLNIRAPSLGQHRRLALNDPAKRSYDEMRTQLSQLHFSLLMFHRLRSLTKTFLRQRRGFDSDDALFQRSRWPSTIVERIKTEDEFRDYLQRASEVLVLRFLRDQLDSGRQEKLWDEIEGMPTGLHALKRGWELYNLQPPATPTTSRAYQQGFKVVNSLLKSGEYGLIQSRQGVGSYFELGVGLLPLLLLLVVGPQREKLQLDEFWAGLRRYGLSFEPDERELLLKRLKSMGLYERFSDAGEANYIRNLFVQA
jgi:hypothetical protein